MIKNGLYNFLGGIIRLGLGVVIIPFLIQILGLAQYGIYVLINSILSFALLSEWSFSTSVTVFLAPTIGTESNNNLINNRERTIKAALVAVTLLSSGTAIGLYLIIPLFPTIFNQLSHLEISIISKSCQVGILLVWFRIIQQFFIGIEQAYQQDGVSNTIFTAYNILYSTGTLLVAYLFHSLVEVFYFQTALTFFFTIIHMWFCFKKHFIMINFLFVKLINGQVAEMIRYSLKAWLGALGGILFSQGDKLLVGNLLGSEVDGIYASLTNIATQNNTLSSIPLQTIIPEITQAKAQIHENIELATPIKLFNPKKIIAAYLINLFLALLLGAGVIAFAPEALQLLKLTKSPNYNITFLNKNFIFLSIIYTAYSVNALGYFILLALRETSVFLSIQLLSGVIALSTIGFLSHQYGLSGAVAGNSLYLLVFCFSWFSAKKLFIPISQFIQVSILPFTLFSVFVCFILLSDTALLLRFLYVIIFSAYALWQLFVAVHSYRSSQFVCSN